MTQRPACGKTRKAGTELDCPEIFMKAVVIYGRHLLSQKRLHEFDILHEVIRAETGYKSNKMSGKSFAMKVFEDFMDFQEDLASALEGWALWEYEFKHWRYSKRRAGGDEYSQLYNTHRLPDYQHLLCPAIPLAFRRWSNFPTCPPTRLRDLARFTDAHVAGMTVDNWRASYRDFLSEEVSFRDEIPRVRNVMMLSLQPKTSIDEEMKMIKAMSALPQKLPTILRSQVYTDLRLPGGQSHPSGKNRSLVWLTDFSSWADFEAFESSQDHLSLMISFQSIIEPHSRVSMQTLSSRCLFLWS
eukprot:g23754.t1